MRLSKLSTAMMAGAVLGGVWTTRALRRFSFQGKRVLVTGGSRGLGLVLARQLADRGARLVIVARDREALERARVELAARGAEVTALALDVSRRDVVTRLRAVEEDGHGPIDVVINDAGTISVGPMWSMREPDFAQAMATHFWGPLRVIEALLPSMRARGEGRIVNIASIGGIVAVPHLLPYAASKFALRGLSEGLRAELAKYGVVVTTVCPGLMRTGSARNAIFKGNHRLEYAWFRASDAMPGLSMSAERAARRILRACANGEGHVVLTPAAKVGALVAGVFPGLVGRALGLVARVLPRDESPAAWFGWESGSGGGTIAALDERAALENNEVTPGT
jgi:short-subunit dehydrogenase